MLELVQSLAALAVTVSILVVFHEYGHYQVARWFKVKVLRFSVGFGPALLRWTRSSGTAARSGDRSAGGTEFVLAAIPLGGYVRFLDSRADEVSPEESRFAFDSQPVWPRIAIVAAGPLANFLLAFLVYWLLFATGVSGLVPVLGPAAENSPAARAGFRKGEEVIAIDGRETPSWQAVNKRLLDRMGETGLIEFTVAGPESGGARQRSVAVSDWLTRTDKPDPTGALGLTLWRPPLAARLGEVLAGSPAEVGGLQAGDRLLTVAGEPLGDWRELVEILRVNPEVPLQFGVLRGESRLELLVTPAAREVNGVSQGYLGVRPADAAWPDDMLRKTHHPLHLAWLPALSETWDMMRFTTESMGKMLVGAISSSQLSGPITIARVSKMAAESGFEAYLGLLALLSIAIGILNLLPIPVLDGGHLLYHGVEAVFGKPLPERLQNWGREVGMVAIFGLMALAIYNDLAHF